MANTLLTPTIIAKEAAVQLENMLQLANLVHRDFVNEFKKIGDTATYRKPVKFYVSDGVTRDGQDVREDSDTVVINKRKHISFGFSSKDLTLTIERFSERYLQPAMERLANQIDLDGFDLVQDLYWESGTPGTTPATYKAVAGMGAVFTDHAVPMSRRRLMINTDAEVELSDALAQVNNERIVQQALRESRIGRLANFDVFTSSNVKRHTIGSHGGTPLTDGVPSNGATSIATDGWTASAAVLKKGDIITLGGVNSVNPVGRNDTGRLQTFVVTADVTADGTGAATINISPELNDGSGNNGQHKAYQTVTSLPADGAAITVKGTADAIVPANLAFQERALSLVTVPIALPRAAGFKARVTHKGISIRLVEDYDIDSDENPVRLDVMYGWKASNPEFGGRLWG